MEFTYNEYTKLIELLRDCGYEFVDYDSWNEFAKSVPYLVIMRHDIDMCIDKALRLAELENDLDIKSTYFVLLTSDFYNVFSKSSAEKLKAIEHMGHELGLHFDEARYDLQKDVCGEVQKQIIREADILSNVIEKPVTKVSYHRPSKSVLDANLEISGMINSYSQEFLRGFKYLSDSRRCWREPILDIVKSKKYQRLHILTHAFWYCEEEKNLHDSLLEYIMAGKEERYRNICNNIRNCGEVLKGEEIYS